MSWHGVPIPFEGRDDWLEQRRKGLGASDIAGVVELSPYATPFTVWTEKVHGTEKEVTEAMHFGKVLEDVIAQEFEDRTGLHVGFRESLVRHPQFSWAMATIDGLAFEGPEESDLITSRFIPGAKENVAGDFGDFDPLGVVEFKTDSNWGRWKEIPDHYQIQVQWQLLVTGLEAAWIVCLHHGKQLEIYDNIKPDVAVQNRLLDAGAEFIGNHVSPLEGEPVAPDVGGDLPTTQAIKDLWDETDPDKTIELSESMVADLETLRGLKETKKDLDAEVRKYENRVKVAMQDAEVGLVDGVEAVTYKTVERNGYTVEPTSYRALSIKKGT